MEKSIKIGKQTLTLDNNVGWMMDYRSQFGRDIIPTLMPALWAALNTVAAIIEETGKTNGLTTKDLAAVVQTEAFTEALIKLSGLEAVDLINITWAMAKCADPDIPEPREWVRQFDPFPVDKIGPEVFNLVTAGVVSSKNLTRLRNIAKTIKATEPMESN